jgi:hypothetical protein
MYKVIQTYSTLYKLYMNTKLRRCLFLGLCWLMDALLLMCLLDLTDKRKDLLISADGWMMFISTGAAVPPEKGLEKKYKQLTY